MSEQILRDVCFLAQIGRTVFSGTDNHDMACELVRFILKMICMRTAPRLPPSFPPGIRMNGCEFYVMLNQMAGAKAPAEETPVNTEEKKEDGEKAEPPVPSPEKEEAVVTDEEKVHRSNLLKSRAGDEDDECHVI